MHKVVSFLVLLFSTNGCKKSELSPTVGQHLTIGGYTAIREVYGREIIPAFKSELKKTKGIDVVFEESYLGSGAQSRAIVSGFEADIASLSLEPDIQRLVSKGLVSGDWKMITHGGMVSQSIVVIAIRKGNPKGIAQWDDLTKPGVAVLTPDPKTSGGAMWSILAIYGSANRQGENALELMSAILKNVVTFDKGARESLIAFEDGTGDAAITYENEVITSQLAGKQIDYVIPSPTILIENPSAVVDANARKHNALPLAQAFLTFLITPTAQTAFAKYGYRPVDAKALTNAPSLRPATNVFTITDLGGWPEMQRQVFNAGGLFERALNQARDQK